MNEALRESLSAVMDGEGDDLALRRLLARSDDAEVRGSWSRYHLARDALKGHGTAVSMDISGAVRAAIDAEETPRRRGPRSWRSLASFAIAASVTAVVVLGGRELAGVGDRPGTVPMAAPVGLVNTLGASPVRASYGARPVPALQPTTAGAYDELARQRLRRYSQAHAEQAALNTPQGLIPFARVPELDR
ncbi:MAG: sigma-E factor negative regulatory protein [Pseudohaliea sp.]